LFTGPTAWRAAENHRKQGKTVLLFPENKSPEDFYWPVQKTCVLVFDLNQQQDHEELLKQLSLQLLFCEAETVYIIRKYHSPSITKFYQDEIIKNRRGYNGIN
jgi:hypothetical protein